MSRLQMGVRWAMVAGLVAGIAVAGPYDMLRIVYGGTGDWTLFLLLPLVVGFLVPYVWVGAAIAMTRGRFAAAIYAGGALLGLVLSAAAWKPRADLEILDTFVLYAGASVIFALGFLAGAWVKRRVSIPVAS